MTGLLATLLLSAFSAVSGASAAEPPSVRIQRAADGTRRIADLTWEPNALVTQAGTEEAPRVTLRGVFKRPLWILLQEAGVEGAKGAGIQELPRVALGSDGGFTVQVILTGPSQDIALSAVGPRGEVEQEVVTLKVEGWQSLVARPAPARVFFVEPGVGVDFHSYAQTGLAEYSQAALRVQFSAYARKPESRWRFALNAHCTPWVMSSGPDGSHLSFYGGELFAEYGVPVLSRRATVAFRAGPHYSTSAASGPRDFGYVDLWGPRAAIAIGAAGFTAHFSCSLVNDESSLISGISNRELELGASHELRLPGSRRLILSAAWSSLDLVTGTPAVMIESSAIRLGISLGF